MTSEPNAPDAAETRAAVLERVRRSWDELQRTLAGLDDRRLAGRGADGWAPKDHLAHLAHWEEYLLARLDGRDGRAELGIAGQPDLDETGINAQLQRGDAALSAADARLLLEEAHRRVVARLETLDAADLERLLPTIEGNTHGHFDEHRAWIEAQTS